MKFNVCICLPAIGFAESIVVQNIATANILAPTRSNILEPRTDGTLESLLRSCVIQTDLTSASMTTWTSTAPTVRSTALIAPLTSATTWTTFNSTFRMPPSFGVTRSQIINSTMAYFSPTILGSSQRASSTGSQGPTRINSNASVVSVACNHTYGSWTIVLWALGIMGILSVYE